MNDPPPNDGFEIVKEILHLIARFKTPATPEVYEVWYQYVTKENESLVDALDYAIDEDRTIDGAMLIELRTQFCTSVDDTVGNIQESMASQLNNLQAIVSDHKDAGSAFAGSLSDASEEINRDGQTIEQLASSLTELTNATSMMNGHLDTLTKRLDDADATVALLKVELAESQLGMMTDPLTGIGNRRFFDAMSRQLVQLDPTSDQVRCLILVDMDRFKSINDTFGHDVGDRIIKHLTGKIEHLLPHSDPARLGGDEFAIFLSADNAENAVDTIENFRTALTSKSLELSETGRSIGTVSVSMGLAFLRVDDSELGWYQRADKLLYEAKRLGGNRLVAEKSVR